MPETHVKSSPVLDEEREFPPVLTDGPDPLPRYAELHCISNFSFQRGASHPQELVRRAYNLGYEAIAITDECSVASHRSSSISCSSSTASHRWPP